MIKITILNINKDLELRKQTFKKFNYSIDIFEDDKQINSVKLFNTKKDTLNYLTKLMDKYNKQNEVIEVNTYF